MSSKTWTLAAAVLGSSVVFLDSAVLTVALPAIGRSLPSSFLAVLEGQTYVYNAYLLSLSALLILAGALGVAPLRGGLSARLGAAIAVLMMVGIPGLPAAVFFGAAVPIDGASAMGWVAVAGAGLMASKSLRDAIRPRVDLDPESASSDGLKRGRTATSRACDRSR